MNAPFRRRVDMLGALVASCFALSACGGGDASLADGPEQALGKRAGSRDNTPPTIAVTSESSVDSTGIVSIGGSASDNNRVQQVTWSNASGGSGTAVLSGSSSKATWTVAQVQLQPGDNTLTFVAQDSAGNESSTTEVVAFAAPAPAPAPTPTPTPAPTPSPTPTTSSTADQLAALVIVDSSRTPSENWAGAQSKYASVPAWTSWVKSWMSTIDTWKSKTRERPDLIGGWMQDYIDPATGIPQTWTPDTPEPPDGVTDKEIKYKRAWVWYLRDYNIRRVQDAARVYRTTGDTRYAEWAASQLDFYAANYASWPERTSDGKAHMYQSGLDEATSSFALMDAARLLEGYAGSTRAGTWRTALFIPMAQNLKFTGGPLTNIGLWHAAAVAAIGMHYRDATLVDWGLNSSTGVRATLAVSMTADYLWNEGSFGYNGYVIAALNSLYTVASIEGQSSQVQPEKAAMARLLLAQLDYRFADGMLPTPSDSGPQQAVDVNQHMQSYRSLPTYWGVQKANAYQSWDILIDPPPAVPPAPSLPAPVTANFPANRMAMLRNGNWSAFVHYGQSTPNHAQQEAPSYELYFSNTRISTDSGIVSYGSPYAGNYFSKAPANNMALVDGLGQSKWAMGSVDLFDVANNRIAVTQGAYLPNASVSRDIKVLSAVFTESTVIRTSDLLSHRLGVAFHSGCTVTPRSGLTLADASITKPPANTATAYWTGMTPYRAAADWSVSLTCGSSTFSYSVHGPTSQTVFIGQGPTTPLPSTRAVLYYETTNQTAQFDASIAPL